MDVRGYGSGARRNKSLISFYLIFTRQYDTIRSRVDVPVARTKLTDVLTRDSLEYPGKEDGADGQMVPSIHC